MDIKTEQVEYLTKKLEEMEADAQKTRSILTHMMKRITYEKQSKKQSKRRIQVPKSVKDRLWDTTFGPDVGQAECYVCSGVINSKRFEAGHVIAVANGGSTNLSNLKCICGTCNKSMGTMNLEEFKEIYFPSKVKQIHQVDEKLNEKHFNEIDEIEDDIVYNIPDLNKFIFNPD